MPDERMLLSNFTSLPLALPGQTTKSTLRAAAAQHFYFSLSGDDDKTNLSHDCRAEHNVQLDRRVCVCECCCADARLFCEPMCCSNGKGVFARSQSAIEINFNLSAAVNLDLVK
jgi:hypothetical protein